MEGYSYGSAGRVFEIAEGAGVIKLALAQHGIIPVIVAPSQLKKFSTGKGMWPKAVAKLKVWEAANNLNIAETIPAKEFDRSDSTVLCRIAQVIGTKEMLTIRASLEVIHELLVGKKQVKKKSTKLRTPTTL